MKRICCMCKAEHFGTVAKPGLACCEHMTLFVVES